MPGLTIAPALLGTGTGLTGLALLYAAWRRPGRDLRLVLPAWGLLGTAVWAWALAGGADRGTALGVVVIMLAGLLLVFATGQWRRKPGRRGNGRTAAGGADPAEKPATIRQWALLLFLAGPLSAFGAGGLALALMARGPGAEADRLMAMAFAFVLLWASGMIWTCTDRQRRRVGTGLTGAGVAGLLLTFLG